MKPALRLYLVPTVLILSVIFYVIYYTVYLSNNDFQESLYSRLLVALALATVVAGIGCFLAVCFYLLLRVSNEKLSKLQDKVNLLDRAPNAFLLVNEEGTILEANKRAEELLVNEDRPVIGACVEDYMPAGFRHQHQVYRQKFSETKGKRTMLNPVPLLLPSGGSKQVEVYLKYYEHEGSRYAIVNLIEVSNVKELQKRAEKLEKNYRTTFEMAPIGIAHIGIDGRFLSVNKQFESLFGYSRYEFELMRFQDLSGNVEGAVPKLDSLLGANEDTCRLEQNFWTKAGAKIWVNLVASCSRDTTEKLEHYIVIVEDITQRKHYESELLASEQRFKTIANHVNGVVWMSTPGAEKILFVNERYRTLWGKTEVELYNDPTTFWDSIVSEDRARVLNCLEQHRQGYWNVDYRIRRPSGRVRHIHDEGSAVLDEQGKVLYMVCLAQDITDEQLYKQRLRATNIQLERLAKFDPLTMTVRRQYATADLEECIALYKRYKREATLIFIDIDHFKRINDTHGHDVGDQVLIEFCRCIRENIRETDDFYRYAGDEFLVLLRETSSSEAGHFLEKLQKIPLTLTLGDGDPVTIGYSSGLCSLADKVVKDANDWVRLADQHMYQNKRLRHSLRA